MDEFKQIICTRIWQIYASINYKQMVVWYVGQIGLLVINFHGLRHKNAIFFITQNIYVAVVAARLGHA